MIDRQLPLAVGLEDVATFDNFHPAGNEEVKAAVVDFVRQRQGVVFLYGAPGSGKTHLLRAAYRFAVSRGDQIRYFGLTAGEADEQTLGSFDGAGLCCLDDVHAAAGNEALERALLALYERCRAMDGGLLTAAPSTSRSVGFGLSDLATRLASGTVYRLQPLDDRDKAQALRLRASLRGVELSDEVVDYVLTRYARDTGSLFALLDRLDDASLIAQRRITIPFLRRIAQHHSS